MKSDRADLAGIINSIGDALIATDAEGKITYLNTVGEQLTGWKAAEAIGRPLEDICKIVGEVDRKPEDNLARKVLRAGAVTRLSSDAILLSRSGEGTAIVGSGAPIKDKNGKTTGVALIFRDQTREREARNVLRESEERFRKIGNSALDALIMINDRGTVEYWNPAAEKMFGYSAGEVSGKNLHDLIMPERYRAAFMRAWEKYIESGKGRGIGNILQLTAKRGSGEEFPMELALSSVKHAGSFWALGFVRDISERRKSEQTLRTSEESLRTTLDSIGDAVIATDTEGRITRMNPVAQKLTGWPLEEAVGRRLSEVFKICNAQSRKPVVNPVRKVMETGLVVGLANHTMLIAKDGSEYQIADSGAPIHDDVGNISGVVLVFRDVTEAYRMRRELVEAEQRFRTFFENQPDFCYMVSADGTILDVNRSALASLGYKKEEIVGKPVLTTLYAPSSREKATELFNKWKKLGRLEDEELSVITKAGEERQILLSTEAHRDADGKLLYSISVQRDITERRRAERIQSALYRISESYRTTDDLRELLREIHQQIGTLMDVTNFYVALYDKKSRLYSFPYFVDEFDRADKFTELPLKGSLTDYVRRTGEPLFADEQTLERLMDDGEVQRVGTPSPIWLGVPLKVAGRVLGVMVVQHYSNGSIYSRVELELLKVVSGQIAMVVEHKKTEEQLHKLSKGIEQSPVSIIITDRSGDIEYVNPRFTWVSGYTLEEVKGKNPRILKSGHTPTEEYRKMWETITAGEFWHGEFQNKKKSGELFWEQAHIGPITDENGAITNFIALKEDITAQKRLTHEKEGLETQLRISQKMEAVGVMAAGIAHDFNNLLTPILGYADMLRQEAPENSDMQEDLSAIVKAAVRAKELVRQVLTFSREAALERRPVRLSLVLNEVVELMQTSLPSSIEIRKHIAPDCGVIMADEGQMHQVLMNLCTNAAHAMREAGGILEIRLSPLGTDSGAVAPSIHLPEGRYLRLTVSDTGCGMDSLTRERIFDPFFTTKPPGEGTGLGLSVLYGIVKKHGGDIAVDSEAGKGATFHVYLPVLEKGDLEKEAELSEIRGRHERILFVDDHEEIVRLVKRMLERLGYVVQCRCSSPEALELFRKHPDEFDLVITDLTMPNLNGLELAKEITNINADIPIILVSGYSERTAPDALESCGIRKLVMKPIVPGEIGAAIRSVLQG